MLRKKWIVATLILAALAPGCASKNGPTGPEGPEGPGGPGVQTVHSMNVSPASPSARVELLAPEIIVDPECDCSSTVLCYAIFGITNAAVPLPAIRNEWDGTRTAYDVEVRSGKVTIVWKNSQSTIPGAAKFVVTVVNKE